MICVGHKDEFGTKTNKVREIIEKLLTLKKDLNLYQETGCQVSDDLNIKFKRRKGTDRGQRSVKIKPNSFFTTLNTKFYEILKERFAYLLRGKSSILSPAKIYR